MVEANFCLIDRAIIAQKLDPRIQRCFGPLGIDGVKIAGEAELGAVGALDEIKVYCAMPGGRHVAQLHQMLCTARGFAVRKLGQAAIAQQMDVFHFQVAVWQSFARQQKVDAGLFAILHFGPHVIIGGEFFDLFIAQCFGDNAVGQGRVYADQMAINLGQFPRIFELAFWIVGLGKPNGQAGFFQAQHRAGVGTMGGDNLAIVEPYIGQKPLIAFDQSAAQQRRREIQNERSNVKMIAIQVRSFISKR